MVYNIMSYYFRDYPIYVPYVPTPENVVRKMLQIADVTPDDIVYDLGAGDGRIVIIAVKEFNVKKAVGIELREDLVKQARKRIRDLKLGERAIIIHGDMFKIDISEATVVTLFLLTSVNEKLRPKLEKELKPGARVVSHEFKIPGWTPLKEVVFYDEGIKHVLYLYQIPYSLEERYILNRV